MNNVFPRIPLTIISTYQPEQSERFILNVILPALLDNTGGNRYFIQTCTDRFAFQEEDA